MEEVLMLVFPLPFKTISIIFKGRKLPLYLDIIGMGWKA